MKIKFLIILTPRDRSPNAGRNKIINGLKHPKTGDFKATKKFTR